jgi:hypothetical protein
MLHPMEYLRAMAVIKMRVSCRKPFKEVSIHLLASDFILMLLLFDVDSME